MVKGLTMKKENNDVMERLKERALFRAVWGIFHYLYDSSKIISWHFVFVARYLATRWLPNLFGLHGY